MDVNFDAISGLPNTYDYLNNSPAGISMLAIAVVILVLYYILFAALGAMTPGSNASQGVGAGKSESAVAIEVIMWSVFILLIIFNALQYFLSINVNASLKNLFTKKPEVDLTIDMPYATHGGNNNGNDIHPSDSIPEITYEKQAFHIPGNNYSY